MRTSRFHNVVVFILQSIKPRVETHAVPGALHNHHCLYPTIHQTKGWNTNSEERSLRTLASLSYNPSNQGLKLPHLAAPASGVDQSLSYNPSNQGLKHFVDSCRAVPFGVFILQSIKPRVETNQRKRSLYMNVRSLSYNPSNQGLKHFVDSWCLLIVNGLYPTIHQTKGWNQSGKTHSAPRHLSLSYNPSNQGLKHRHRAHADHHR